jgi:hypothetical protein
MIPGHNRSSASDPRTYSGRSHELALSHAARHQGAVAYGTHLNREQIADPSMDPQGRLQNSIGHHHREAC